MFFACCFILYISQQTAVNGFMSTNTIHLASMTRLPSPSSSEALSLSLSNTVGNGLNNGNGSNSDRMNQKRLHRKRHQIRQRHNQWPPSYHESNEHRNLKHQIQRQRYQQADEDQVQEWLLQSTSLILGEELTLELINNEGTCDDIKAIQRKNDPKQEPPTKKMHFANTDEEYILHAESVMRAWGQWIARCSTSSIKSSLNDDAMDDKGVLRCSAKNASKIVDAILTRALEVIGRRRSGHEGDAKVAVVRVVNWDTKLIELINVAIDACANSKNVEQAGHWLQFLQQTLPLQKVEDEENASPFSKLLSSGLGNYVLNLYEESYRGVIRACIRSHERKYLERAIGLLEELSMQQQLLYPATQTYNLVLYGLANCDPCSENAERAETILHQMIACEQSSASCGPDSNSFRQVVTAWGKSFLSSSCRHADAAGNARRILDQMLSDFPMLDPDASTFNAIMTIYLKLERTDDALALFDLMHSLQKSGRIGTKPDTYSLNLLLKAMTKQPPQRSLEDLEAAQGLLETSHARFGARPDVSSYNILIDGWAKSDAQYAANRAEQLLETMERKCRHDRSLVPDGYSFTSTINAIERSRHHKAQGAWAEKVFHQMKELHFRGLGEAPTTPVYNALLNCLVTCEAKGSLEKAEELFSDIVSAGLANTRTYNTMMKGYSMFRRSKIDGSVVSFSRPRKAEKLLDEMELSYYRKGDASPIIPDKYSYTTVTSAYGRSSVRRKAAKALMILQRMLECYSEGNSAARPITYAFNAVLNACAHTRHPEERLEAFTILCSTLILQKDYAKPDHTTYGTFLQACARLLPRDEARKWRVVETVFNSCIKEGQCGELVLKNLKGVASPELYEALVGRFLTNDGLDIPLRWRRNVAGKIDSTASN